jgi:hypothetical protein
MVSPEVKDNRSKRGERMDTGIFRAERMDDSLFGFRWASEQLLDGLFGLPALCRASRNDFQFSAVACDRDSRRKPPSSYFFV